MNMSTREIVQSYREAKDQNAQIKILAELNCCSKADIVALLEKEGLEVNKRVLNGGNLRTTTHNSGAHKKPVPVSISVSSAKPAPVSTSIPVPVLAPAPAPEPQKPQEEAKEVKAVEVSEETKTPQDKPQDKPQSVSAIDIPNALSESKLPKAVLDALFNETERIGEQIKELKRRYTEIIRFIEKEG